MSSSQEKPDLAKFEAFLDGALPDDERAAMSRDIAGRPDLQREIELQRRIDGSLQKSFVAPELPAQLLTELQQPPHPTRALPRFWLPQLKLVAAVAAVVVVWGVIGWRYFFAGAPAGPACVPALPLDQIYANFVAAGFQPMWVCKDDAEFASTFQTRQGQRLLLAAMPAGTKMEGLSYANALTPNTTVMLARVDETPVLVFVDRADADPHPAPPPAETKLHEFRKVLGPLVLYEVTPLDRPRVMDFLYMPN